MTAPERRWFRFTLRTLFVVVTLFACAAGWLVQGQLKVRERYRFGELHGTLFHVPGHSEKLPWNWKLFNPMPIEIVWISEAYFTKNDVERVQALFPEAEIILVPASDEMWQIERELEERSQAMQRSMNP